MLTEEYDYFIKEDFSEYDGSWVAIIEDDVVAFGDNIKNVYKKAKEKFPRRIPFIVKIDGRIRF